ncbi:MAG: hypothetical protein AB7O79_03870 [Xanthobacteraceae bacterium]
MKIPYEFHQLAGVFYPGSNKDTDSLEGWVESVVRFYGNKQYMPVIKKFIDELLEGNYSDEQLKEIWNGTSAGYDFSDGGHRVFFSLIRDAIERDFKI